MKMNQAEIEIMARNNHACPNVRKAVRLLQALVEAVNAQSDGWAYWSAPSRAAEPLMDLLRGVGNLFHDTHGTITEAELRKAITPIRSMVTRQKKIQARHGNRFEFDVDAALDPAFGIYKDDPIERDDPEHAKDKAAQPSGGMAIIPCPKPPVKALQDAARKAETMFRNFAGTDPGACLTAGSEHGEACEMADELRDANAQIDNWREFLDNCARPGDVANVILERDNLRTQRDKLLTCAESLLSELVLADPTCSGGHRFAAIKEAQRLIARARS